jgi:tetratricopeptide (TPR) repeat protein
MNLDTAEQFGPHRSAALFQLAALAARDGARGDALRFLNEAISESPLSVRSGAITVALLRADGKKAEALAQLDHWRAIDPTNSFLRYEATRLGGNDPALWEHLAADPERILELVADYLRFGLVDDALDLLTRTYPTGPGVVAEPGTPRPEAYPLIAYYRGYVRSLRHESPDADYAAAAAMPTTYVFPNRPESLVVLTDAATRNPKDATAHFLLGSLHLSSGNTDAAIKSWELAASLNPAIPTLHRNLGLTLLERGGPDIDKAIAVLRDGTKYDPRNVGVYTGTRRGALPRPSPRRRTRRRAARLPRSEGAARIARLQARDGPRAGRAFRRGREAVRRPLLPARGRRHQRPPDLARRPPASRRESRA